MSDERPDLRVVDEDDEPRGMGSRIAQMGLAAYTLLILTMAGIGTLCAVFSLHGAISQLVAPKELSSGFSVDSWRLAELRKVDILGRQDTPDLYHDHSQVGDGSSGCMVVEGEVVRWDAWIETGRVPVLGSEISSSGPAEAPTVTVSQGEASVDCPFDEGEGGERFATMLRVDNEGG